MSSILKKKKLQTPQFGYFELFRCELACVIGITILLHKCVSATVDSRFSGRPETSWFYQLSQVIQIHPDSLTFIGPLPFLTCQFHFIFCNAVSFTPTLTEPNPFHCLSNLQSIKMFLESLII